MEVIRESTQAQPAKAASVLATSIDSGRDEVVAQLTRLRKDVCATAGEIQGLRTQVKFANQCLFFIAVPFILAAVFGVFWLSVTIASVFFEG